METTFRDVRYALRMLRKNPGFTVSAVLALMLGIASSTVIFSVIDGVLLRPLPYPEADRILYLSETVRRTGDDRHATSAATYLDWAAQNTVFSHVSASRGGQVNFTDGERAERVRATAATANYFQVFGVAPYLGRTILASDEAPGNARVIVLSYAFWEKRFGSDRDVIGRDVHLNGEPHRIIGVMPQSFAADGYAEIWQASPYSVPAHTLRPNVDPRPDRDSTYLDVWARLKPGVTM